eukprot:1161633-Pelagomonas_calceolata.AAC.3
MPSKLHSMPVCDKYLQDQRHASVAGVQMCCALPAGVLEAFKITEHGFMWRLYLSKCALLTCRCAGGVQNCAACLHAAAVPDSAEREGGAAGAAAQGTGRGGCPPATGRGTEGERAADPAARPPECPCKTAAPHDVKVLLLVVRVQSKRVWLTACACHVYHQMVCHYMI